MTPGSWIAALTLAAAAATSSAHAAAPVYAGTLQHGLPATAAVAAESGPWGTPERWSLWRFDAVFDAAVSITVTPQSPDHDVFIAVWYGLETDTANYFDMNSGSLNTVFVDSADAAGPFQPDGPGRPAALRFVNDYGSGPFVLAVADYVDGRGSGFLPYTVTAAVPEPATAALWAAGLFATAAVARRRRRR